MRPRETGLTEEELTQEVITSSGQKVYRCKKCDKEFSFSSRLKRHLLVHTGARPFECQVCFRRFTQAVDLKRHMLRHSGQKPHVCQFCGKQYTRGDRLKVHLTTHTDVKHSSSQPYNCSRCSAGFDEADQLRLHICDLPDSEANEAELSSLRAEMAEEEGDETLGECKFDAEPASAVKEPAMEKPFKCDECNSTFTKATSLKSHLVKHTGEKRYKCSICFKTFFSSSSLKIHVRVHTGDRPFKCKQCPRSFSDPSNFNKHKRWHAKQKDFLVTKSASSSHMAALGSPPSDAKRRRTSKTESLDGGYEGSDGIKEDHKRTGIDSQGGFHGSAVTDKRENLFPGQPEQTEHEDDDRSFTSPEVLVSMEESAMTGEVVLDTTGVE